MAPAGVAPPHLRGKAVPPHLRNTEHGRDAARAVPNHDKATATTPQTCNATKTNSGGEHSIMPPATVPHSRSLSGLAASRHAPPSFKNAFKPIANNSVRNKAAPSGAAVTNAKSGAWNAPIFDRQPPVGAVLSDAKSVTLGDTPSSKISASSGQRPSQGSKLEPVSQPPLVPYANSESTKSHSARVDPTRATQLNKNDSAHESAQQPMLHTDLSRNMSPGMMVSEAADKKTKTTSPVNSSTRNGVWSTSEHYQPASAGVRQRGGRRCKDSRWPKASEIPKANPHRWATTWMEDNCSIDSARADSGWGGDESKWKRVKGQDGIDPETGFKLTSFGGWAPPPLDWDARPAFRPQQSAAIIEAWMDRSEEAMDGNDWAVPQSEYTGLDGKIHYFAPDPNSKELLIQGDLAPRYWSPIVAGGESPATFWQKLITSKQPCPMDQDDLVAVKPWWETYEPGTCNLRPYEHPQIEGIQHGETQQERLRRENDSGSLHHAENRKRAEIAKQKADREKRKRAQERARKLSAGHSTGPSRRIKPGLPIYLRPAYPEDTAQITRIYNWYVETTVCVPEVERRAESEMLQVQQAITAKKLPFLVACERGGVFKSRKKTGDPVILPDKIVGFAHAKPYHDIRGMYRFTCEIEIYVDSTQYMKGIGSSLMDKMLGLLDDHYMERGGYGIEGESLEGVGTSRVVANIVATVPFDKADRLEWKSRFLTKFAGFEQTGLMMDMGMKLEHRVSVAVFQRKTGFKLDPSNPPIISTPN